MGDPVGHLALVAERVDGAEGSREVERGERVEVAGFWIWVRRCPRGEHVGQG